MLLLGGDCSACHHERESACACASARADSSECLMSQLRQVSQAKRWDDVGTGRRTIRQSRLIESLEFPDEEYGFNLGIVSVAGRARRTN